ncbi:MAG: N-acetylmuramoyl-L-alanine amidase [Buchnera aphidicola (Floraphis choui)]
MDAGHGGKDPGAIGINKTQEKNIAFKISKKLEYKLNKSKLFKVIMIRNGNYYLSISKRTNIANKNNVNLLISIHTNSSKNSKLSGLSMWVLSKRGINSEITNWSKKRTSKIMIHTKKKNINLRSKTSVLNLKFNCVQKLGNILARTIIKELKNTSSLKQINLKYASFGILKSPHFPSILIETGFISNRTEERKLNNKFYQQILVNSIYLGLKKHFFENNNKKSTKTFFKKCY